MGVTLGIILGAAAKFLAVEENPVEEELKAMLPGTQCGQCGYVGCAPYAEALAKGESPITLCVPGGKTLIEALGLKLGISVDIAEHEEKEPEYAFIIEDLCIGCTRCIRECNVDAILGANKSMHTIIKEPCHGCIKCVDVCPTGAIEMRSAQKSPFTWRWPKPEESQHLH
jgi:electron transport complex protein RnfB